MEQSFFYYINQTKSFANSVLDKVVPQHGNQNEVDHVESLTSSDDSEAEDTCTSHKASFNIDTIFSVPESDDEKSKTEVLNPYVIGHNSTLWDTMDSHPNVSVMPASSAQTEECKRSSETNRAHKMKETKKDEAACACFENVTNNEHQSDTDESSLDNYQPSCLTDNDLDTLEKTMMTTCMDSSSSEGTEESQNATNKKVLLHETKGKVTSSKPKLRIFLFGKTGAGKSSTANTIIGRETFQTSKSFGSITTSGKRSKASRFGYDLEIIDTPGLLDNRSDDSSYTENEILRSAILCSPGFHVALFVMQYGRITKEDEIILQTFKQFFGDKVLKDAMLVFTGVDTPEDRELLQIDVKELSQKDDVQESTRLQQELLKCFEFQYMVMRNRGTEREKEVCAHQLVDAVAKRCQNGQRYYTSAIFRQLEDVFMYIVRDDEVSYLLDVCKEQKDFLDEIAILQLVPKVQVDFLYEILQYSDWLNTYTENGLAWKEILSKLKQHNTAELNLHEIETLKQEQIWRESGHKCHKIFMEAVCELQIHHEKKLGTSVLVFQKRVAEFERQFNMKSTRAREAMKCEAETSLRSFLAKQGWERLISSGLVAAAVGGGVIAFGPLLAAVVGAGVATKVLAFASAALWGFKRWTK